VLPRFNKEEQGLTKNKKNNSTGYKVQAE
jgi:hypothetical protein